MPADQLKTSFLWHNCYICHYMGLIEFKSLILAENLFSFKQLYSYLRSHGILDDVLRLLSSYDAEK